MAKRRKIEDIPLASLSFFKIRDQSKLYVDKTGSIVDLVNHGDTKYFLSRPRKFGKSLLLSTLEEYFKGNKKLFGPEYGTKLVIYDADDLDWKPYPIIKIDFISGLPLKKGAVVFEAALCDKLDDISSSYGLILTRKILEQKVEELITKMADSTDSGNIVVLIDEYDAPIVQNLQDEEYDNAIANQKALTEKIRFMFITGVSKFAKTSLFSSMNDLDDISLGSIGESLLGYTWEEIQSSFGDRFGALPFDEPEKKLREWYDGYRWGNGEALFNPWSINKCFSKLELADYWTQEATPSWLSTFLNPNVFDPKQLEGVIRSSFDSVTVDSFRTLSVDIHSLLFQTGFLTVKKKFIDVDGETVYQLGVPNKEVIRRFSAMLSNTYGVKFDTVDMMRVRIENDDIKGFLEIVDDLLKSVPDATARDIARREGYYHSHIHVALMLCGSPYPFTSEAPVAGGRIDLYVQTRSHQYIIELTVDGSHYFFFKRERTARRLTVKGICDALKKNNIGQWKLNTKKEELLSMLLASDKYQVGDASKREINQIRARAYPRGFPPWWCTKPKKIVGVSYDTHLRTMKDYTEEDA